MKRFHRKGGETLLMPENKRMKPISVEGRELVIQGRVIAVQRFYR